MYMLCYIDPSAVTYMIQAVAAAVISLGAVFTIFRHKIVGLFDKRSVGHIRRKIRLKEKLDEEGEAS